MKKILIALVGIAIAMSSVFAATWYVSPDGNDANSGINWAMAKQTIQAAVGISVAGDTVIVPPGVYTITDQIILPGGVWLTSQSGPANTIILGNGTSRCVYMPEAYSGLKGFTITGGGNAEYGAGVYCYGYGGTVVDCVISNNHAIGDEPNGGGVYCLSGIVSNCVVRNNSAVSVNTDVHEAFASGGGIFAGGGCQIDRCVIADNNLTGYYSYGAGINAGQDRIDNCIISGNTAYGHYYANGGGVDMIGVLDGRLRNCLVTGNRAYTDRGKYTANTGTGGGVDISNGGEVQNCTISGNSVDGDFSCGGGLSDAATYIGNTIICGNTATAGRIAEGPDYYIGSLYPNPLDHCLTGGGVGAAGFASGSYRLGDTSPCINAGTNAPWMTSATDLDGNMRIWNGTVDMGAYEYGSVPPTPIMIKANGSTDNVTISNSANLSITVQLDPGEFSGVNFDWWVIACANGTWFYMDSAAGWSQGSAWHPVHQGALFNLPAFEVLNMTGLSVGSYTFWFAVDYPMDGILNVDGQILLNSVNVIVQ